MTHRSRPVEFRAAEVGDVNFAQRLIEIIAVPYDQKAKIRYRGQIWDEVFERGSFDGIEERQGKVWANRDHDDRRTIGKAVQFWPSRIEGLVGEVRVSKTDLGDETLALAADGILSSSVGFGVRGSDEILDKSTMTRRIKRAFLDHLAFVTRPAYEGAQVLAVRDPSEEGVVRAGDLPQLVTPHLDELLEWQRNRRR